MRAERPLVIPQNPSSLISWLKVSMTDVLPSTCPKEKKKQKKHWNIQLLGFLGFKEKITEKLWELWKAHIRITTTTYKNKRIKVLLCCWLTNLHKPFFDSSVFCCICKHSHASYTYGLSNFILCVMEITWTRALMTSMGLVTVEAVAAARGPAIACSTRCGQLLGAILDNCSVKPIRAN